jgi:hypothetical protein
LIACYNIATIGIDIFQFHVSIINNLVFPFIIYLLPLNNFFKNENKVFSGFFKIEFSTQFPSIIPKTSTLGSIKKFSQEDSKSQWEWHFSIPSVLQGVEKALIFTSKNTILQSM